MQAIESDRNPARKLLIFHSGIGGRGVEGNLGNIFNYLNDDDFETHYLVGEKTLLPLEDFRKKKNVHFLRVPLVRPNSYTILFNILLKAFYFARWFGRRRKEFHFVLTSALEESIAAWFALSVYGLSRKLIIYHQNHVTQSFRNASWIMRQWEKLFIKANKQSGSVVGTSTGVLRDLTKMGVNRREFVHPGCINENEVSRLAEETPAEDGLPGPPIVLYVGRLVNEQKRIDLLLSAVSMLTRRPGMVPFRLLIVGSGMDLKKLEKQTTDLEISSIVQFLGEKENPFPYFKVARTFVLPSDFEGFGIVIIEAMACGVPVIATDCPSGPREILEQGGGLLVPPGDVEQLADAVYKVITDDQYYLSLKAQALSSVKRYECSRVFEDFKKFLLTLEVQ